jgi:hypothetical protein
MFFLSTDCKTNRVLQYIALKGRLISDGCTVIEKRTQELKPCIFPFKFFGQTLSACTTLKDPEDKPWCSTKVDDTGNHVISGGYWGHCDLECGETQKEIQKAEFSLKDGKSFF